MPNQYTQSFNLDYELADTQIKERSIQGIKKGDWVYCRNIPGTAKVIDWSYPWYTPNKRLYLVEFQGKQLYEFESEVENA